MLFNSVDFLFFFPIVVLFYFLVPKKLKNIWLLISSYYFYMFWEPVYALLILFSTVSTYFCALVIDRNNNEKQRKLFLGVNIALNLLILFYFKYFNFFIESLTSLFPSIELRENTNLLLVVGISFYTFQSLGYSIDVYRRKISPEKNFLTYALFVSFFPQLVAGPIERSTNLLPQFHKTHKFNYKRVTDGLVLMAFGFFKKLVIADSAAQIINSVYNSPTDFSGLSLFITTVLFAFQIYGDFSGYSDIAIGAANVLGYKLMRNFNHPYFSKSVPEFWKRWHISLSSWFMDYVYIPLGGSRKGKLRTYINLLLTFLVSGLWHGASWTFVIWGLINGFFNTISKIKDDILYKNKEKKKDNFIVSFLEIICTFFLIDFTWIFFRANSISDAFYIIQNIFADFSLWFTPEYYTKVFESIGFYQNNGTAIFLCILFLLVIEMFEGKGNLILKINSLNFVFRWIFYYAILLLILFFGYFGQSQFIYFQF